MKQKKKKRKKEAKKEERKQTREKGEKERRTKKKEKHVSTEHRESTLLLLLLIRYLFFFLLQLPPPLFLSFLYFVEPSKDAPGEAGAAAAQRTKGAVARCGIVPLDPGERASRSPLMYSRASLRYVPRTTILSLTATRDWLITETTPALVFTLHSNWQLGVTCVIETKRKKKKKKKREKKNKKKKKRKKNRKRDNDDDGYADDDADDDQETEEPAIHHDTCNKKTPGMAARVV